jgi:hypothetical protein
MAIGNMIRVIKGNQELLVSPVEKERLLADGYSVIDEDGTILEQGVKSNHVLKTELDAANKRIEELEAELKKKTTKKTTE